MTHPGDNPFANGSAMSFEDELEQLLDSADALNREAELDAAGNRILKRIFPIFDRLAQTRIVDIDHDITDALQNERFHQLKFQFEIDYLETDEGKALAEAGMLESAVEYQSNMAVVAERKLQKYIFQRATKLIYEFENLSDDEKLRQLDEFEEAKRIYLVVLRDFFKLDMAGWPAAFDEVTPGIGIGPGIDLDDYLGKAAPYIRSFAIKSENQEQEIEALKDLIRVQDISDVAEIVTVTLALVVIQEKLEDLIDDETGLAHQIISLVESIGSQCGLSSHDVSVISGYYLEKYSND